MDEGQLQTWNCVLFPFRVLKNQQSPKVLAPLENAIWIHEYFIYLLTLFCRMVGRYNHLEFLVIFELFQFTDDVDNVRSGWL